MSSFALIRRLLGPSLSAVRVVSPAWLLPSLCLPFLMRRGKRGSEGEVTASRVMMGPRVSPLRPRQPTRTCRWDQGARLPEAQPTQQQGWGFAVFSANNLIFSMHAQKHKPQPRRPRKTRSSSSNTKTGTTVRSTNSASGYRRERTESRDSNRRQHAQAHSSPNEEVAQGSSAHRPSLPTRECHSASSRKGALRQTVARGPKDRRLGEASRPQRTKTV